jgi:hypothetical protein
MTALELPTEDFRRLAADIVDLCAGYLRTLDQRSTFPRQLVQKASAFSTSTCQSAEWAIRHLPPCLM